MNLFPGLVRLLLLPDQCPIVLVLQSLVLLVLSPQLIRADLHLGLQLHHLQSQLLQLGKSLHLTDPGRHQVLFQFLVVLRLSTADPTRLPETAQQLLGRRVWRRGRCIVSLLLQLTLPLHAQLLHALLQLLQGQTRLRLSQLTRDQLVLKVGHGVIRSRFAKRFLVLG